MNILRIAFLGIICISFLIPSHASDCILNPEKEQAKSSKLLVVWSSGDRDVTLNMVFMYTYNGKKFEWWERIRLVVWGASSKLLAEDKELQQEIKKMKEIGVELFACKACADRYGVSEALQKLGIEVKYMGKDLTDMLRSDWISLTF